METIVRECTKCKKVKRCYRGRTDCISCRKNYQLTRYEVYRSSKYPAPKKAVYAIFNEEGTLMYIGESSNTPIRLFSHFQRGGSNSGLISKGYDTTNWSYGILWSGDNDLLRKIKERELIKALQPKINKRYK